MTICTRRWPPVPAAKRCRPSDGSPPVKGRPWLALCGLITLLGCADAADRSIGDLRKGETETRRQAARTLSGSPDGRPGVEAVPALTESVGDPDPEVRRLSAYALGRIGPEANTALPTLRTALEDAEEPVRLAAAYAINGIDPADASAVPVLSAAAGRGDARAVVALGRMGPAAADSVPALNRSLRNPATLVRCKAAEALGRVGPAAKSAVPALKQALRDPDEDVRSAAAEALRAIEPES